MVILIPSAELDIERYKRWLDVLAFSSVVGTPLCLRSSIPFSLAIKLVQQKMAEIITNNLIEKKTEGNLNKNVTKHATDCSSCLLYS